MLGWSWVLHQADIGRSMSEMGGKCEALPDLPSEIGIVGLLRLSVARENRKWLVAMQRLEIHQVRITNSRRWAKRSRLCPVSDASTLPPSRKSA